MKTSLFCLLAIFAFQAALQTTAEAGSVYESSPQFEMAIRGQNPPTFGVGPAPAFNPSVGSPPPAYSPPVGGAPIIPPQGLGSPYSPIAPPSDPFLGIQSGGNPYAFQRPSNTLSGLNGPQPFRYGWTDFLELGYAPSQSATGAGGTGSLSMFEFDYRKQWVGQGPNGWMWTFTPEFNYRSLGGPGTPDLSPGFYRFAGGIKLNSPTAGPWSWQLGFTPSIGTDFGASLKSKSVMFDGEIVLYNRMAQDFQWVLGVSYWDRVDDILIPQVGFVWTPNQFWEWRLVFPKPRVDVFIGTPWGAPTWLYARAEYHVEAYQADLTALNVDDRMQIEDWRAFVGLRTDNGYVTSFAEVGAIFNREFTFQDTTAANFDVGSGFMFRMGVRY